MGEVMSIKVTSQVRVLGDTAKPDIRVHAHWNDRDKVVLEIGEQTLTVLAADLKAAIENACNTGAYL